MTAQEQYQATGGASENVLAPLCYLGIDEDTPLGKMVDTTFNLILTTTAGVSSFIVNVSNVNSFLLTGIYIVCTSGTIFVKPYDNDGNEIFTDFFLSNPAGTDPFPLVPPYPFDGNDNIRFDVLATGVHICEVLFRGLAF